MGGPGYSRRARTRSSIPRGRPTGSTGTTSRRAWAWPTICSGTARRPLKFNLGKYMEAFVASNSDFDLNPLIRTTVSTTRVWTDTNKDFVPNCDLANPDEERRVRRHGEQEPRERGVQPRATTRTSITGFGNRPYNWCMGVSVQQEVLPRVSVNVGYFRNWWGNWYAVDNRATRRSDYTPFSITAPVDARLPGGGGQRDQRPVQPRPGQGRAGRRARAARRPTSAKQTENWQGVDVNVVRAAAERAHGAGRHEHRPPARGRLRDSRRRCRSTAQGPTGANNRRSPAARW